jgi:hypothetical protein
VLSRIQNLFAPKVNLAVEKIEGYDDLMSNDTLNKALEVMKELGGYFVIRDAGGEEFVVMRRADMEKNKESVAEEKQLSLPAAPASTTADDVLERINQELALYQMQQVEENLEEAAEIAEKIEETVEAPMRIRFEPLHGDLPPELQD